MRSWCGCGAATAPASPPAAGGAAAAVLVIPYAIVGGIRALKPVTDAADRMSRASIWQLTRRDGIEHLLGLHNAARVGAVIGTVGPAAVLGVVGLVCCSRSRG